MYEKNLWEKIGDLLSHPGKRFLLGLLSVIILGPFGVMIAISIAGKTKTTFVSNLLVNTKSGNSIPCALIKQKHYAYFPVFPINLFCLFFYIPYKTEYYVIKNLQASEIKNGDIIYSTALDLHIVRSEKVTKAYAEALQKYVLTLENEVDGAARQIFLQDTKKFFETGILKELYFTEGFSICSLKGNQVVFFYEKDSAQVGCDVNDDYTETVKTNPNFLLDLFLTGNPQKILDSTLELTEDALERIIRKDQDLPKNDAAEQILNQRDNEKAPITIDMIESTLKTKTSTSKKVGGWLLCFLALGSLELGIFGMVGGIFIMGIIFLAIGIWVGYLGIKKIRQGKQNSKTIQNNQYKIIKVECTSVTEEEQISDEGVSYYYRTTFANGYSVTLNNRIGLARDFFYFVYLDGVKEPVAYYNATYYHPAPELVFEEYKTPLNENA